MTFSKKRYVLVCFISREKTCHDRHVQDVIKDSSLSKSSGVKGQCPLTKNLEHFHVVEGYPPNILHDVLEGIVPVEASLCLTDLIAKKYFTLDILNRGKIGPKKSSPTRPRPAGIKARPSPSPTN